jgi:hypothetical protein
LNLHEPLDLFYRSCGWNLDPFILTVTLDDFLLDQDKLLLDSLLHRYRFVPLRTIRGSRGCHFGRYRQVKGYVGQEKPGVGIKAKIEREALASVFCSIRAHTLATENEIPEKA